jgi:hypothetical protein
VEEWEGSLLRRNRLLIEPPLPTNYGGLGGREYPVASLDELTRRTVCFSNDFVKGTFPVHLLPLKGAITSGMVDRSNTLCT